MSERSAVHDTFIIERNFDAIPARVFAAFAEREAKAQWFEAPASRWKTLERTMDFRVGGSERLKGRFDERQTHTFEARYYEIVPEQRIVYSYEMYLDDARTSVSLATIEIAAAGQGTRLRIT